MSKFFPFLLILVLVPFLLGAVSLSTRASEAEEATSRAVSYLKTQESSPWIVMALAAAGESPDAEFLKDSSGLETANDVSKHVLALAAAGKDPRSFPDEDLVARLKGFFDGSQFESPDTLNDDMWAVLALRAVGVGTGDPAVAGAVSFLLENQNEDGGWAWNKGGASDTNDTSIGVIALLEAGMESGNAAIQDAVSYLKTAQNEDGGFPYDPLSPYGTDSDANSDAFVGAAISKLGQDPASWEKNGNNLVSHLLSLQAEEGFFAYQEGQGENAFTSVTTAQAVIALTSVSYPVASLPERSFVEVSFRIEGASSEVCRGKAEVKTAMDVVREAAGTCGYSFVVKDMDFGPYLTQIGEDAAEGLVGWLYLVNWVSPSVGADDYVLAEGDSVLWYYGEWGEEPLRLSLARDTSAFLPGETVEALLESFNGVAWRAVSEAVVLVNGSSFEVPDGNSFVIPLAGSGVFEAQAEKEGFVRSNPLILTAAESLLEIPLEVEIVAEGGGSEGGSVIEAGFSVSTARLDFGRMSPGKKMSQQIVLRNEGTKHLQVKALVEGDEVFRFLRLNSVLWDVFEAFLATDSSVDVDVSLATPPVYRSSGKKEGTLLFWGKAAE
ncbi:MAG: DUF4430 domain-containing protein [Patescibacteria group bacterium]